MAINRLPRKSFCFGTQYYRMVPMESDWERDLRRIKDIGMDTVRLWALWKWAEPVEGEFFFDDLHGLIELARRHELEVILVIEMDKVPNWLREVVPDHALINLNGNRDQNEWGYVNWDHPQVRHHGEKFLREVCRQFGRYDNVIYDVWNEPDKPEDRSPHSRAKFFRWLQQRFSSLGEMIETLHLPRYDGWDQVPMPTSPWDTQLYLLYQEFRTWSIAEQVRWASDIVRSEVPGRPVTVHVHCDEHPFTFRWFNNFCEVGWDDWGMHKQVDFYISAVHEFYQGEGIYTKLANVAATVSNLETKRSITGGQYWTTGLAGGASKLADGRITGINPGENLFSLWMLVAHEAKGVVYWQYRVERLLGPEAPGWGLAAFDGGSTFRTEECRNFISRLRPFEDGIMAARVPRPKVAVLYSLKSHIINETQKHVKYIYAFEGACHALYMNNIAFDVVNEDDSFEPYETILAPGTCCLKASTVDKLTEFVAFGGKLVIEAGTGSFNEYGIMNTEIPFNASFVEAAGIQEKDILYSPEFGFRTEIGLLTGFQERRLFDASPDADILGWYPDGQPAVTRHQFEQGMIIYFSTHVLSYIRLQGDAGQTRIFTDLIGVKPEIQVFPLKTITARVLENEREHFLFVFNHSPGASGAMIGFPFQLDGIEAVHRGESQYRAKEGDLTVQMGAREALVLRVPR